MDYRSFLYITFMVVEAIASLIPIYFHLNKLIECHYLQVVSFPKQHALNSLLDAHHSKQTSSYCIAMSYLTLKQYLKVKNSIVNTNNCLNQVFSVFNNLNREISLGFHLIDTFSDHFFFHTVNHQDIAVRTAHQNKLKNIYKNSTNCHDTMLIISDMSVKNNIITSVSHIQRKHEIIMETVYHVMNVIFIVVKIFAIRYSISQASQIQGIIYIVIVTSVISAAKRIFDMSFYLY